MKVLEAFSVMRMNDGNFTSTLQKKLSPVHSESRSTILNSSLVEKPQRPESVSSSNSSDSPSVVRRELQISDAADQLAPNRDLLQERRYSASFRDIHNVQPIKEPWSTACPPYTSEADESKPPPYTEKPVFRTSFVEDDVVARKPSAQGKHKQFSFIHKMRQKRKSAFTSPTSDLGEKQSKVAGKMKSSAEKRSLFSGIKQLSISGSAYGAGCSSKSREGKTGSSKHARESSETKI